MQEVEFAAAQQHLLSTYSSPCFNVKTVYNYRLWELIIHTIHIPVEGTVTLS
jgi:hypothetical protein